MLEEDGWAWSEVFSGPAGATGTATTPPFLSNGQLAICI